MLSWVVAFLVIAIIATILGFGSIASTAASMAQVMFYIFLILFLATLVKRGLNR